MRPRSCDRGRGGTRGPRPEPVRASMRPRSCDRGRVALSHLWCRFIGRFNEAAVLRPRKERTNRKRSETPRGFNEAAVLRPRKAQGRLRRSEGQSASMRPRSCDRGRHRLAVCNIPICQASMRPRSCDRGRGILRCPHGILGPASMRPRSCDRGRAVPPSGALTRATGLQ